MLGMFISASAHPILWNKEWFGVLPQFLIRLQIHVFPVDPPLLSVLPLARDSTVCLAGLEQRYLVALMDRFYCRVGSRGVPA